MKYLILLLAILPFSVEAREGENMIKGEDVIRLLDLKPLPEEGGYYRETYRSTGVQLSAQALGINSTLPRNISTAIYYLVLPQSFSALHRIKSDEVFHFYAGDPVDMIQIDESGNLTRLTLGSDIFKGESPQIVVPRGVWQGLRLRIGGSWALMGTTVAPGFEFEDFEVGVREKMVQEFPQLSDDIIRFTREIDEKAH